MFKALSNIDLNFDTERRYSLEVLKLVRVYFVKKTADKQPCPSQESVDCTTLAMPKKIIFVKMTFENLYLKL